MRALVIDEPGHASVLEVDDPSPGPQDVVVRVERVGICGTDFELFDGRLAARLGSVIDYPLVPGHEWTGLIVAVGAGVPTGRVGERVVGSTFIGCGACTSCGRGRVWTCPRRQEVGVRGRAGAAAELIAVPSIAAVAVPRTLSSDIAALIEPFSNVVRAWAEVRRPADAVLIRGAGTLGILGARLCAHDGAGAIVIEPHPERRERAVSLGLDARAEPPPGLEVDAVLDCAPSAEFASVLALLRPGGTLVVTGFPDPLALLNVRDLVDRDLRVIGTLGGVDHFHAAADLLGSGAVTAADLLSEPIGLDALPHVLSGSVVGDHVKTLVEPNRLPRRGAG